MAYMLKPEAYRLRHDRIGYYFLFTFLACFKVTGTVM
jgi:hypothetical protein